MPPAPSHPEPTGPEAWRGLYPFAPNRFRLAAGEMHYVDEGPGREGSAASDASDADETLLFVHGNPTWSFHWRNLILGLRGRARCVAPDHLGCGLSDKPDVRFRLADRIDDLVALVRDLDLRGVTLVAQDWGGAIGLGAALREPERFRRIMLFNTGAFPPWFVPKRIAVCRTPVVGEWGLRGLNLFSRAALRMTLHSRRLSPSVEAGYLAPYDSWAHRLAVDQFVRDIPTSPRHPTWGVLEEIERGLPSLAGLPIRLVWGMRDWCFTPACLDRFLEHWPQADAHRFADAGHWVVEDAPEECERLLEEFVLSPA
ncbi:Haloalkane dehalogenase [Pseudobythopirellula maris]|uniref:Haloalkane dehalogenase n=1 Tax=Pseudobythopirellula maris TaxID=2527991 RepID=A0A5C5ZLF2_9BACT|nr:alpha/beta fold hydrolase [Pseudobythopirellula maris]TWT88272.1 Haloalkane dehalogenase [Pseudobythopirellula maris]